MKEYNGCMEGIDNEIRPKWEEEYKNLTFDIIKDYLNGRFGAVPVIRGDE